MVELSLSPLSLDSIFQSLADPTRRDILRRVAKQEMSISDIAKPYKMSFAAIAKHLSVLAKAQLIIKKRKGKEQIIQLSPAAFKDATAYLKTYEKLWNDRLDHLEHYLATLPKDS
jgi:DNA-binding transcriptional ArsR family regulator